MKLLSFCFALIFLAACKKEDPFYAIHYAGHYKGTVQVREDSNSVTLVEDSLAFFPTMEAHRLHLMGTITHVETIEMSSESFQIPLTVIGDNGVVEFVESGEGYFKENKVYIDLFSAQRIKSSGAIIKSWRKKGTLEKQ